MKLLGSTESKITRDENGENVPHLEGIELVLVHGNHGKPFGSLLEISPTNHVFLKTFNSEFQEISIWFTDQDSKPR